jgi:ketosteroid isomerase-like protein
MYARIRIPLAALASILLVATKLSAASAQEKHLTTDQKQIVDTVSTIFTAARADDVAMFDSVIAPDFYIFDVGARFNGDSVMASIKALHAAGKRYEWNVTQPDVHISGNTAWIAYVNQGSISDASSTMDQTWLESAFLQRQAGVWKIVFMHSTGVPRVSQQSPAK